MANDDFDESMSLLIDLQKYTYQKFPYLKLFNLFNILQQKNIETWFFWNEKIGQTTSKEDFIFKKCMEKNQFHML